MLACPILQGLDAIVVCGALSAKFRRQVSSSTCVFLIGMSCEVPAESESTRNVGQARYADVDVHLSSLGV